MRHWQYFIIVPCCVLAASGIIPESAKAAAPTEITPPALVDSKNTSDLEVVRLRGEITTLMARVLTLEQNVELLLRTQRSGLSPETPTAIQPKKEEKKAAAENIKAPIKDEDDTTILVQTAEIKIQQHKYSEAIEMLTGVYQNFPNRPDAGHTMLLLAQCYIETKKYPISLDIIQDFFLRFKEHSEFLFGKILEGKSYDGMGLPEKAIQVYRDVVSLAPKTAYAQTARQELQRLRDAQ